jgi:hypothetical protein
MCVSVSVYNHFRHRETHYANTRHRPSYRKTRMLVLHLPSAHLPRTNARLVHGLMIPHPHTQGNSDSIYGSHDDHSTFGACCDLLLLFPLFCYIRQLRPMRTSGVFFAGAGLVRVPFYFINLWLILDRQSCCTLR